jgi:cyanobactin maturation PatA/PatG family protease
MPDVTEIPGFRELWATTQGDSQICVAVLDGLVDQTHPCFEGANLTRLQTLLQGEATPSGTMSQHGTHVASVIFGQYGSPVQGIAPQCRGLIIPVFCDRQRKLSQLDLSRAIEQAVSAGAQIINISGGELTEFGEAEDWLLRAVRLCEERNVLIVAAAGNDGCECLHVPAALAAVLAVGAMNDQGQPIDYSNWGETYQTQGILASGENILGAKPGGGTVRLSGTSFATPIVSGVAALLLSLQLQQGEVPDPQKVRAAILNSALPCDPAATDNYGRCLVGKLNIAGAKDLLQGARMSEQLEMVQSARCGCGGTEAGAGEALTSIQQPPTPPELVLFASAIPTEVSPSRPVATTTSKTSLSREIGLSPSENSVMPNNRSNAITASQPPNAVTSSQEAGLVYALGTLGYDFGLEARRDSFKQLMPAVNIDGTVIPANPYDARQMVDYLTQNLSEAKSLIWTLNLELTPIYAIEPYGPFARDVYGVLQELLSGQVQAEDNEEYIQRVSIPGRLSGRTVRLFSGQVVPVIAPENTRGLYGWRVNSLISAALETVRSTAAADPDEQTMRRALDSFLNRIYYDLRNLGTTSQDRALNFAATNAFQAASTFAQAVATGMELDSITLEKSPFCRIDSDCWDVKLKFFDPENGRRAKKVFRFTIDVSDIIPVTLGEVRSWSTPY